MGTQYLQNFFTIIPLRKNKWRRKDYFKWIRPMNSATNNK